MVDVDGSTPNLSPGTNNGSIGASSTKLDELRQLLLEASNHILGKLGLLKKEIQTIVNSDQMQDKKLFCDTLVEIAKVLLINIYSFYLLC
jgi:hypothetical protein